MSDIEDNSDEAVEKEHHRDKRLHPELLHLKPLGDPEALADPEPLHPEPLHLDHVGDDEDDNEE